MVVSRRYLGEPALGRICYAEVRVKIMIFRADDGLIGAQATGVASAGRYLAVLLGHSVVKIHPTIAPPSVPQTADSVIDVHSTGF